MSWYRQGLQVDNRPVFDYFWTQTYVTAFNIDLNISSEAWPIVFSTDKVFYFINTKMSYQRIVVVSIDKLCLNGFRYKW